MAPSNTRPPVIALVDDEPMVTGALASILQLETDYDVRTFISGAEALEGMKTTMPDVVVSDFMMPGMNGLEFLAEVRKLDPEVPRIMLTGYADKENAIRAINEVGLFQYLEKPLDNEQLLMVLRNALANRGLQSALQAKISELDGVLHQHDLLAARDEGFQRELDWAQKVQARFLPDALPDLPPFEVTVAYEPSMGVGGDFYGFVPLDGGNLAVVVADSAGHGVQAALGTALLKFAIADLEGRDLGPGEILSHMNGILFRGLPRDIPVAAAAAVLEPGQGRIRLVGAGLPYPMLVGTDGSVTHEPASGLLLGLVDGDMYTAGTEIVVEPAPGEVLLMFSDGLTEAQDAKDEFFGEGPLDIEAVALAGAGCAGIVRGLADRALAFGLPEHRDDLTVVGLAVNG
jgi:serine phosphatase RsbU (regulator of sigma subunit)